MNSVILHKVAVKRFAARIRESILKSAHHEGRRVVLLYHSIGRGPMATSPEAFAEQMRALKNIAEMVSVYDLLKTSGRRGELLCAVTFDDGYLGVYEHAADILQAFSIPATVFICSSLIHPTMPISSNTVSGLYRDEYLMTWPQLLALTKMGFTIGSHLTSHVSALRLSPPDATRALTESRQIIEAKLGSRCDLLAYPWGLQDKKIRALAAASGYKAAFSTVHAAVPAACDPMQVPRMNIAQEYTASDVVAIVRGEWDFLSAWYAARACTLGRVTRP
jgi:peptidoglycan/xylan/chitin deacetylase (PgdA/CDA1 family)